MLNGRLRMKVSEWASCATGHPSYTNVGSGTPLRGREPVHRIDLVRMEPGPTRANAPAAFAEMLSERGEYVATAAHEARLQGRRVLAYPDNICTVPLWSTTPLRRASRARERHCKSYRTLARHGLRQFIYSKVGYVAEKEEDVWRIFRDRVSLTYDAVPAGHFGIFKELSSLIVTLGLSGFHIDEHFVPDVSVGQAWAVSTGTSGRSQKSHGTRATYPHNYPPYFPQAASNPQLAACYPENALGEFRRWFQEDYIGEGRFKSYLLRKAEAPCSFPRNTLNGRCWL